VATYLTNEASFELEGSFTDHTVHWLEAPLDDGEKLRLYLSREPLPAGRTIGDLARGWIALRTGRLAGFGVIAEREDPVAGAESFEFSARFCDGDAVFYERQVHLAIGGVWYRVTARAHAASRAACDEAMDRIGATILFRGAP
jgi:hypothetical protein